MIIGDAKKHASAILTMAMKPKMSGEMQDAPEEKEQDEMDPGLEACAQDVMDAMIKRDVKALAMAMKDFFEMADKMPHEETDHSQDEDQESAE